MCSRQPRSFQGVDSHGRPDGMDRGTTGTDDGTGGFRVGFISHPDVLYYIRYSTVYQHYYLGLQKNEGSVIFGVDNSRVCRHITRALWGGPT